MKRLYPALTMFTLLMLAGIGWAGDLKIIGPSDPVAVYKAVRLKAQGGPENAAVIWDIIPEEAADIIREDDQLIFVAPPGDYKIKCRTILGRTVETARFTVKIGVKAPEPMPKPPDPKPTDPPPTQPPSPAGLVWAIIVQPDGSVQDDVLRAYQALDGAAIPNVKLFRREVSRCSEDIKADVVGLQLPALLLRKEKQVEGKTLTFDLAKPQPLPPASTIVDVVKGVAK